MAVLYHSNPRGAHLVPLRMQLEQMRDTKYSILNTHVLQQQQHHEIGSGRNGSTRSKPTSSNNSSNGRENRCISSSSPVAYLRMLLYL